jgi:hypothetical protein
MIKETDDITSKFIVQTRLTMKALRLYFDNNGYMLVLDTSFNIWQMNDRDWRVSTINTKKGANPTKVNDILYDNDGKLYGLVFPLTGTKLAVMKQTTYYYLSLFLPYITSSDAVTTDTINYVLNDNTVIKAKTGVDISKLNLGESQANDELDNDVEQARVRDDLNNEKKLRALCRKL